MTAVDAVDAAERLRVRGASGELRGTQSFVRVMGWCWRHPGAVALEVLWRWVYGAAVLGVLWRWVWPRVEAAGGGPAEMVRMESLSLLEPTRAVVEIARLGTAVWPTMRGLLAVWGPVLVTAWVGCATVGRWAVLRRTGAGARARMGATAVLQALRVLVLLAVMATWLGVLREAAERMLLRPIAAGGEPALVGFFAVAIFSTLLVFVGWSLVSYAVSLPPLLATAEGLGAGESWRAVGGASGPLRMKLIEINLVMGIVKVALLVLLMVFSACPLPFQSVITTEFLLWWTGGVAVLYCVASDFFHVARQVACLRLWEFYRVETTVPKCDGEKV